jgi:hypothetical protein
MIVTVIFTQIKVLHAYCMLHAQHTAQITQLVFVYVDSSFFCLARYHFLLQYINSFRDGASHNRSGTAYSSHSHGPQERADARPDSAAHDGTNAYVAAGLLAGFTYVPGALQRI